MLHFDVFVFSWSHLYHLSHVMTLMMTKIHISVSVVCINRTDC